MTVGVVNCTGHFTNWLTQVTSYLSCTIDFVGVANAPIIYPIA